MITKKAFSAVKASQLTGHIALCLNQGQLGVGITKRDILGVEAGFRVRFELRVVKDLGLILTLGFSIGVDPAGAGGGAPSDLTPQWATYVWSWCFDI